MVFSQASSLYRALLKEAQILPGAFLRQSYASRIRDAFRSNSGIPRHRTDVINPKLKKARAELRRLRAANAGNSSALNRIMDLSYGRRGRLRRELMSPLLNDSLMPARPRIIKAAPRSAPPNYPPALQALFASEHSRIGNLLRPAQLESPPALPPRADPNSEEARLLGPLSLRRRANIHWRFHSYEVSRIYPPLEIRVRKLDDGRVTEQPNSVDVLQKLGLTAVGMEGSPIFEEIERLARSPELKPWTRRDEKIADLAGTLRTKSRIPWAGKDSRATSNFSPRFLRRRYQELLSQTPLLHFRYEEGDATGRKVDGKFSVSLSPWSRSTGPRRSSATAEVNRQNLEWIELAEQKDIEVASKTERGSGSTKPNTAKTKST